MKITLLSQILEQINRNSFNQAVKKHQTDKHNKGINSWTHLVTMLFLHLARANSIREVTNGLKSITGNLNHLGIQNKCPADHHFLISMNTGTGECSGNFTFF